MSIFAKQDAELSKITGSLTWGAVHVWMVHLSEWPLGDDDSLLTQRERRAARSMRAPGWRQFVRTYSVLRRLLGAYLGMPPAALAFTHSAYGRPYLDGKEEVDFNLSYSRDWMVLAVARGCMVGVDIEAWREPTSYEGFVAHYFSANEKALRLSMTRLRAQDKLPVGLTEEGIRVCDLAAPDCHVAALAVQGSGQPPTIYRWQGEAVQPWGMSEEFI